jgi:BMFP domain-containing protein YqiC
MNMLCPQMQAQQELAAALVVSRENAASLAAANANLDVLRERCARVEAELAQHAHPHPDHDAHGGHGAASYWTLHSELCMRHAVSRLVCSAALNGGEMLALDAADGMVEAPGTPVATSAHRTEGSADVATPAKAAILEARVAELEARPCLVCPAVRHACHRARSMKASLRLCRPSWSSMLCRRSSSMRQRAQMRQPRRQSLLRHWAVLQQEPMAVRRAPACCRPQRAPLRRCSSSRRSCWPRRPTCRRYAVG